MNLIGSVNIQYSDNGETLLSFATPKTNRDAMEAAKKAIKNDTNKTVTHIARNPPEHGANVWSAFAIRDKHLAWITLNEVTVPG